MRKPGLEHARHRAAWPGAITCHGACVRVRELDRWRHVPLLDPLPTPG
nr:J60 [uncultured bacterium]